MMRAAILAAGAVALVSSCRCLPSSPPSPIHSIRALTPACFHAQIEHGTLTLRGSLPSETSKAAILQRAQELYGAAPGRVVDELTVDPRVGPAAWAGNVPKALPILGRMTERGSIIIDGRSIVLSGLVDSDRAKATVLRDIAPLTADGTRTGRSYSAAQLAISSSSLQKKLNEILSHASINLIPMPRR